jgi:hypothetical protein
LKATSTEFDTSIGTSALIIIDLFGGDFLQARNGEAFNVKVRVD